MAENKRGLLSLAKQKIGRQSEKIRKKLTRGEADADASYHDHVANFNKQCTDAQRLNKEALNYMKAFKAMSAASKALGDAIKAVYEPDWPQSEEAYGSIEAMEHLYSDHVDKLTECLINPMQGYVGQFPDIRARVAKRDRRKLDFDRTKRALEAAKEKQSPKLPQAEEAHAEAQRAFEIIDRECNDALPSLYENRLSFYSSTLEYYCNSSAIFNGACQSVRCTVCKQALLSERYHAIVGPGTIAPTLQQPQRNGC
eukprot:TRINITY_DN8467_c0_g1_i3.p1 TRINITY_DN8467_c0_g1~~TRINITY_DN8467_c0_g1_i3.p1  ORF type:complete len:274 (+),score=71.12 TRINITY_DN8467_c0_g1_i3:59-823(+)